MDVWLFSGIGAGAALLWAGFNWRRHKLRGARARERIEPDVAAKPPHDDDLNAALYAAARNGNSARALELLSTGADARALPPSDARDQRSLIALAAVMPDITLLRALIAHGLDINHAHAGISALIAATRDSRHGRPDAVMTLLSNGADPRQTDNDGNTPLHYAARNADANMAALLCAARAEIEARNHDGITPLGMACACGNWQLAKFLIEHGARTETAGNVPALLSAATAEIDDPAGVELLLKHKARVNSRASNGRSALNEAALHGNINVIRALIAAGADANNIDGEGYSPLLDAARGGHLDALNTLMMANANIHLLDAHGRNALVLACLAEHPSLPLVQRLVGAGVKTDLADNDGKTAINYAVSAGRWTLVKQLDPAYSLPPGISETETNAGGQQSPLGLLRARLHSKAAISDEHAALAALLDTDQLSSLLLDPEIAAKPEHLNWLLAQGVNPNHPDANGHSSLHHLLARLPDTLPAVQTLLQHEGTKANGAALAQLLHLCLQGQHTAPELEQCALDLIARGATLRPITPDRTPLLPQTVRLGWDQLLEHLVSNGVDLNSRDSHGLAALHIAAALGRETALRLLLRHGARVELRTQDGQTALGIALAAGRHDLADWLDWRGWPLPGRALQPADVPAAALAGDAEAVLRLIDLGLPLDATDAQGCTALIRAAGSGQFELTRQLLEHGANIQHAAHSGATALSAAVSMEHQAIIASLLQAGAEIEQRLPGDLTVLMLAAARGLPHICQQLIDANANLHAVSARGLTALHCAAQYGFTSSDPARLQQLFSTLISAGADCNANTADGRTPLLMLLGVHAEPGSTGDESVVETGLAQLLEAGSQVNVQERRHGFGPLHLAALHGLSGAAHRLLRAGADPEIQDKRNRPPRTIAITRGFIDIATELTPTLNRPGISMARFLGGQE